MAKKRQRSGGEHRNRESRRGKGQSKGQAQEKIKRRNFMWRWRRSLYLMGLMSILAVAGVGYVFSSVPLPDTDPPMEQTTFICAGEVATGCNGDNSIAQLSGGVDRVNVTYDQLPSVLINAVVAAEDRGFFDHGGVDPIGIARAFWANVRSEDVQQGGSTITQQYVKNVYLTQERTFSRKIREAALAVKIERELPKQEILLRYLNAIYFGRGAYGVQAASKTYFGVDVEQLTLSEAAYLAGLIRSPETADAGLPEADPRAKTQRDTATQRRNSVLDAMLQEGYISQSDHAKAAASGWDNVVPRSQQTNYGRVAHPELGTNFWIDYVLRWLTSTGGFSDAEVYGGGLRVYTTLDFEMQAQAIEAVTSTLNRPGDPQAALVAIDDHGRVRAMLGGLDHDASQVNLAVGVEGGGTGRQPGSSFKPFALAEALKQGMSLTTTYNSPSSMKFTDPDTGEVWKPSNYADAAMGNLNLVQATQWSSNTAYAQLVMDVGVQNVVSLAHRMGVTAELPVVPSVVLGTGNVSVLDMASAYSTLADRGEHIKPIVVTRVTDSKGTILYEADGAKERVLTEEVADSVNWTLNQVVERGTGISARFDQPSAGKTGTTENYRDAWFVGFTCKMTAAVWMGYPGQSESEPRYMDNVHGQVVTGGSFPAEIWRKFMTDATDGLESCPFERPSMAPASSNGPPSQAQTSGTTPSTYVTTTIAGGSRSTTTSTVAPVTTTTAAPSTSTTAAETPGGGAPP